MTPKVSVLVPVYGVEKFIERCARSLFEQTMPDGVEYIFVNDCTKDQSIEILEKTLEDYPHRKPFVRIIHHDRNMGLTSARNTSIDHATGNYICIVDSDDYVETNMLEVLYNKAIETDADIVTSKFYVEYSNRQELFVAPQEATKEDFLINMLESVTHSYWFRRIYKRELLEKHHIRLGAGIDGKFEDLTTFKVAYYASKIAFVEEALYHYVRYNAGSYMQSDPTADAVQHIYADLDHFFEDKEEIYREALTKGKVKRIGNFLYAIKGIRAQKILFKMVEGDYRKHFSQLSTLQRMAYTLAGNNLFWLLNIMVYSRRGIKELLRISGLR